MQGFRVPILIKLSIFFLLLGSRLSRWKKPILDSRLFMERERRWSVFRRTFPIVTDGQIGNALTLLSATVRISVCRRGGINYCHYWARVQVTAEANPLLEVDSIENLVFSNICSFLIKFYRSLVKIHYFNISAIFCRFLPFKRL